MGGATAPWWVVAMTAVATVIGAWGAQWIAARNARHREREQHKRDLEINEQQRQHDVVAHWRDQRLSAYSELLAGLHAWETALRTAEQKASEMDEIGEANRDQRAALQAVINAMDPVFGRAESNYSLLARVQMVGSPHVIRRAQAAVTACLAVAYWFKKRIGLDLRPHERIGEEGGKYLRNLDDALRELREDMRRDLGIPDADDHSARTSIPPG